MRAFVSAGVLSLAAMSSSRPARRVRTASWPSSMPRPCSALSSNSELDHAGPCPSAFTVYGDVAAGPPQMDEQPVAFAMYMRSPNSWVTSLRVGGLGAAGAGARELQQRLLELAALDAGVGRARACRPHGPRSSRTPPARPARSLRAPWSASPWGTARCTRRSPCSRAERWPACTDSRPRPCPWRGRASCLRGRRSGLVRREGERADGGVRAHEGAVVALDARLGVPGGHAHGHATLLVGGGALLELAVDVRPRRRTPASGRRPCGRPAP